MARQEDSPVMLSRSEASPCPMRETLRCDSELALNIVNGVTPAGSRMPDHAVMLSRSEASPCPARETLRCAQSDTGGKH
jgi:hypothetical protein